MKVDLPDIITKLSEIQTPNKSVKGYLIQGTSNQAVFFVAEAGAQIPEHSHAAEWGIVIEGEFEITVGNEKRVYKKGDTYFVPDNVLHSGYYRTNVISFHVLDDKDRFKLKTSS